jgi:hypothetical protein
MPTDSPLEAKFAAALASIAPGLHMACERQYAFALAPDPERAWTGGRRWKADFAWPDAKVIVEVEGIYGAKSRHRTASGYHEDCNKYNVAGRLGYTVLRYTSRHLSTDEGAKAAAEEVAAVIRAKVKARP